MNPNNSNVTGELCLASSKTGDAKSGQANLWKSKVHHMNKFVLPTAGMYADYNVSESKIRITQIHISSYFHVQGSQLPIVGDGHPTFNGES